jgi:ferritin
MAEQPRNLLKREVVGTTPTAKVTKAPSIKGKNILLSDDCVDYLNYRVQQEEYSGRIYMSMAMWLENNGYVNAGKLWRRYSDEEMKHADIARTYLLSMGVQPLTPKLDAPNQNFSGLPEIIEMSYDHEITVTKQIKDLAGDAMKKADHMLYELALSYLKEQVEEHNKMQNWVDQLNSFGTDKIAMRLLDHEMKDYL